MENYEHWQLHIQAHIAYLTLCRPQVKNRIDGQTLSELARINQVLSKNPEVWVIVVQAEGEDFSTGVDVSAIGTMIGQDSNAFAEHLRGFQKAFDDFEALEKPTIAALKGHVIGGGVILALCCDFRIAADNTRFCLPEVKRSIGVIMGTQRLTRTIGLAHTKELVLLGEAIHAERAHQMGLVNQVVPLEQLTTQVQNLAQKFSDLPPLAVGLCKKIIHEGQFLPRAGQDLEIEAQSALLHTEDFKEAIKSFFEKRKPIYQGK